jgi:hypothetical protein
VACVPSADEVFAGKPEKHHFLEMGWPELFAVLNVRYQQSIAGDRFRPCEMRSEHPGADIAPGATARLFSNGPAACPACLAKLRPGRPGGYPLHITDPRKMK